MVTSSSVQAALRRLVPAVKLPCDFDASEATEEEIELHTIARVEAEAAAEAHAEAELNSRNVSIAELHGIVPHMEHLVYQASCLVNDIRVSPIISKIPAH